MARRKICTARVMLFDFSPLQNEHPFAGVRFSGHGKLHDVPMKAWLQRSREAD